MNARGRRTAGTGRRRPPRAAATAGAAAIVLGAALNACAANSVPPMAAEACRPPEESRLASDYDAAQLAGVHALWMFADEGEAAGAAAGGRLELEPYAAGQEPLVGGSPARLYGTADIDLTALGAADTGDPASEDVQRPGVLVLQWRPEDAERPSVVLRLGSTSNRLDRMVFDGSYAVLRPTSVSDTLVSGHWESGAGRGPVASGRFCAVREDQEATRAETS